MFKIIGWFAGMGTAVYISVNFVENPLIAFVSGFALAFICILVGAVLDGEV